MENTTTINSNQRPYALFFVLGMCILLYRTLSMMIFEEAFTVLVVWASVLLVLEFLIDLMSIITGIRWFIKSDKGYAMLPLRLAAAGIILHAVRVLIYALGRTELLKNFDVKPVYRPDYTFEWFWVYFACIMSFLGVVGVIVVWLIMRANRIRS